LKKTLFFTLFILGLFCGTGLRSIAQDTKPDAVSVGIYITSIHDIDFKQKEYTVSFWLWFNYKNPELNFIKYLEIPQAKTTTITYSSLDTTEDDRITVLLKLQCVMKDWWKIDNFPFNRQNLRLSIENAQYDINTLVFAKDTSGKNFDSHALSGWGVDSLKGWAIDTFKITIGTKEYETAFGDASVTNAHSVYSAYKVRIGIKREAWGLFWKIFLGMYVAFLIAYACFYIHADNIDSRFGLSVGSLFAVIGNKYIIEASLPETTLFSLVDILHGLTLFFILSVIIATAYVLRLVKQNKIEKANRMDMIFAQILLVIYVILNIYFISKANMA